jgi:hypothetical protein
MERQQTSDTLHMAYADPPYPGQSLKHYGDHQDYAGEVDHAELIEMLELDYPDGWALSTSSPALRHILPLCPLNVRVMAWVKPFAAFKRNVRVAYAWEPVIVCLGERAERATPTRDYVSEPITMRRGFTGAKPERFCFWLFEAMGLRPCDQLDDLFPGSGAVARAWRAWSGRPTTDIGEQGVMAV